MMKSLFNKHLGINLFQFCFRLCPTVYGNGMVGTETNGSNRTQIGHNIRFKFFHNNGLCIYFRDSGEEE